jgi:hypothetical protein
MKPDFALGRLGFEIRGRIADLQRHGTPPLVSVCCGKPVDDRLYGI